MPHAASTDKVHLGFLRIVSLESGFVGGLLITNRLGRPLEFQCTTPVRPNRTQELLYGPTLESFLFSEVLGKTLCDRVSVKPDVLLVDQPQLLALRERQATAIVLLAAEASGAGSALETAEVHLEHPDDREWLARLRDTIPASADIREPLERVKDALIETLRSAA